MPQCGYCKRASWAHWMEDEKRWGTLVLEVVTVADACRILQYRVCDRPHEDWHPLYDARMVALQWQSPGCAAAVDVGKPARLLRIVTPLDEQGKPHGVERYLAPPHTNDGFVWFEHGQVITGTHVKYNWVLPHNAMHTLQNMHDINRTRSWCYHDAGLYVACRNDVRGNAPFEDCAACYSDATDIVVRARMRFLMVCFAPTMRTLPWELRSHIFSYVLPEALHHRRLNPETRSHVFRNWMAHCC